MESDNFYYNKDLKELARWLRKNSTKAEVVLWKEVFRGDKRGKNQERSWL